MSRFLFRRLLNTVVVLFGVATVVFFLVRITGDPVTLLLPIDARPEAVAQLRQELGLDQPLAVQYVRFISSTARGDFGASLRFNRPAMSLFVQRFPATAELVFWSIVVSLVLGIPLGVIAAAHRGTRIDSAIMSAALFGQAIPGFYLGLMMILLFSVQLHWLPTGGRGSPAQLVMPVIALASYLIALIARMTRSSCLDVLGQDFIRTARAKGLRPNTVLLKHTLKAALIPIITLVGLQIGSLFSGAVVTETVFSWPGIGRLAIEAIYARDFPVVQVVVIMSATVFVLVNVIVDVLYAVVDPRIRYD
jgi:peptide/nickel transport system permease protein